MNTDVAGRVRNVQLPTSKPLLPLFEAIMNSMQAIEDAKIDDGRIEVEVLRDPGSLFVETERAYADVGGFIVTDNGIGFDETNFEAFSTSDTTYKASRGGKGIGRFMWLAAFESVEIDSVFRCNGDTSRRSFTFRMRGSGIENERNSIEPGLHPATTVKLTGYRDKYRAQCPKRLETIAAFIIEEFLEYFIGPNCPVIVLRDRVDGESILLGDFFDEQMSPNISIKGVQVKGSKFEILHVRLYSTHITEHRLYFCAHGRVVVPEKLVGRVPNLVRHLQDEKGEEFVYAAYVNSPVLNTGVNADRTGFNIPEDRSELIPSEITLSEMRQALVEECKIFLHPYTLPIAEQKRARVQKFIESDGAMYRPILNRVAYKIEEIDPDSSDDEIDRQLYEAYHKLQVDLRQEAQQLMRSPEGSDDELDQFEARLDAYFEQISEVSQADLARYVLHRKAIIEFFRKQLSMQENGKYRREDRVHSIIFPRGKTSNEILFEEHNLWLLDERLAFHAFLSSDQPIGRARCLQNDSRKEPDILIFDRAFAFSESSDVPFSSITIIEFKKPQRGDYSETENPFVQITKYVNEINSGKAKTRDGRPVPITPNLPFYCYVVCDIPQSLKEWAYHFDLLDTPDGLGFFGYKKHYNAYFEVISYSKLVADAEKRNKAFFHKLGLPNRIANS